MSWKSVCTVVETSCVRERDETWIDPSEASPSRSAPSSPRRSAPTNPPVDLTLRFIARSWTRAQHTSAPWLEAAAQKGKLTVSSLRSYPWKMQRRHFGDRSLIVKTDSLGVVWDTFIQILKSSKLQHQYLCQPVMLSVKSPWVHQETSEMISVDVEVVTVRWRWTWWSSHTCAGDGALTLWFVLRWSVWVWWDGCVWTGIGVKGALPEPEGAGRCWVHSPPSHLSRPISSSPSHHGHTDTGCDRSFYLPQLFTQQQEVTHMITCHSA